MNKICIECKYCRPFYGLIIEQREEDYHCVHPQAYAGEMGNDVTGYGVCHYKCHSMRTYDENCGRGAKWWEPNLMYKFKAFLSSLWKSKLNEANK